jgi:cardiolipin synthase
LFKLLIAIAPVLMHWSIVIGLGARIILRRRDIGTSLAWLTLVALFPFVGAGLYLLIGELWLARTRVQRAAAAGEHFDRQIGTLIAHSATAWAYERDVDRTLHAYASRGLGVPTLAGNQLELFSNAASTFDAMIRDIDASTRTCHMLFYIWASGGRGDEVADALIRAQHRGVACRVLVDAVGSRSFLASDRAAIMRRAGIELAAALPVGRLRSLFARIDLRNHRKIAVFDGAVAYCGSLNLADPTHFKQNLKVGEWIDVMARVQGPTAQALDVTMLHDWYVETGRMVAPDCSRLVQADPSAPGSAVAVISSGPAQTSRATQDMILAMLYGAREEIIITTPYFIPGDVMMNALIIAARCGVRVRVVLPAKVDSRLVRLASRAYFDDLLAEGIELLLYRGGLLHAKTVTVDRSVTMIGSANLDRRSFSVNFETSLFIYDNQFTSRVRALQQDYAEDATSIIAAEWKNRSLAVRLAENTTQLLSPLL